MRFSVESEATWPVWDHLKVECGQLWGRECSSLAKKGEWRGRIRELGQEPALALELSRVSRPRRSAKDPSLATERVRALLAFAADAGPVGQQGRLTPEANIWTVLEEAEWALAHAAALDFMLTLSGAFFCGETKIVQRQLLGVAEAGEYLAVASGNGTQQLAITDDMRTGPFERRLWALADGILSPNLQGRRAFEGGQNVLHYDSLFSVAHSQMAVWLQVGNFGRCETCFSYFPKADKRQKYCPPAWSEHQESQCGSRARMRRRRGSAERFAIPDDGQNLFLLTQDNQVPLHFAAYSEPSPS